MRDIWLDGYPMTLPANTKTEKDGRPILAINSDASQAWADLPNDPNSRKFIKAVDENTGVEWTLRRMACGGGCFCAASGSVV